MCISPVVSLAVWICLAAFRSHAALGDVGVFYKKQCPQLDFAAGEISASLKSSGKTSAAIFELADLPNAKQQLCIAIAASPEESHQLSAKLAIWPVLGSNSRRRASPMKFKSRSVARSCRACSS